MAKNCPKLSVAYACTQPSIFSDEFPGKEHLFTFNSIASLIKLGSLIINHKHKTREVKEN